MILTSRQENSQTIYSLQMTEDEFVRAQKGETIKRIVQWSKGEGSWAVAFKKLRRKSQ